MHRQWWTALAWCFAVAMGVLVFLSAEERPQPPAVTNETAVTRGSALPAPAPPESEPPPAVEVAKAEYRGNIRTKKFHRLSCRYANCPNCRAKFATREEAIAEGFDPCGVCDP